MRARMTELADWVVADSHVSRSGDCARSIHASPGFPTTSISTIYKGLRAHARVRRLRLMWSGIGKKAAHLLEARDVFAAVPGLELVLVVDEPPSCLPELRRRRRAGR